jgi:hypothetical protein
MSSDEHHHDQHRCAHDNCGTADDHNGSEHFDKYDLAGDIDKRRADDIDHLAAFHDEHYRAVVHDEHTGDHYIDYDWFEFNDRAGDHRVVVAFPDHGTFHDLGTPFGCEADCPWCDPRDDRASGSTPC